MSNLYLISPPKFNLEIFKKRLNNALSASNKIAAFQLRLKNQTIDYVENSIKNLLPICRQYNIPFIINDFYHLASKYPIDGIHIGQNDGNIEQIIQKFKGQKFIGVSCANSIDLANMAEKYGASYVSFGAFFGSKTKKNTKHANISIIEDWKKNSKLPCAAIGGIDEYNISKISKSGANYICVISDIWDHDESLQIKKLSNKI